MSGAPLSPDDLALARKAAVDVVDELQRLPLELPSTPATLRVAEERLDALVAYIRAVLRSEAP